MTPPPAAHRIVVAVDGPASSGKSSVGMAVAGRLGLRFLDTGLIYRALTALAIRTGTPPEDQPAIIALIPRIELADDGHGRLARVLLDGLEAVDDIHTHEVDAVVSAVARQPDVRAALLAFQRHLALAGGVLMAGRDIGTVVLPDAGLKVFLDASLEERAMRRIRERGLDPAGDEADAVREQLRARDVLDSTREVAPLRIADDAVVVTTDGMGFDEVVDVVAGLVTAAEDQAARTAAASPPEPAVAGEDETAGPKGGAAPEARDDAEAGKPRAAEPANREPVPRPVPEPGPRPNETAPRPKPQTAPTPPPRKHNPLLDVAMRLDNGQTILVRMVARVTRWLVSMFASVRIEGLDRIPRGGAVIIAVNHASNVDVFAAGGRISDALRTRRIHWLGKRELFDWPLFGWLCAHGGVHPVDRSTADVEAYRLATRILERGYVLWVFPEGTRSPTGALQEAKDGVAQLALRTGALVVPVGINDSDLFWPKSRKIPRLFPRRRIRVRIGDPFRVADLVPPAADRRAAKTAATRAIMGRIAELLEPRQRGVYASAVRGAGASASTASATAAPVGEAS